MSAKKIVLLNLINKLREKNVRLVEHFITFSQQVD